MTIQQEIRSEAAALARRWEAEPRWHGVHRPYGPEDVVRLRGRIREDRGFARSAAERLWSLVTTEDFVAALGCMTGGQAVECAKAGLRAVYLSGWQVAADANLAQHTYPDQSLYPVSSVPAVVRRVNNALRRADQIAWSEEQDADYLLPVVADAEAGFGGPLNAFELMTAMIEAGAAGVHFEDQLSSEKKCGHLGGKVLVPTQQFIRTLVAARLAADVLDVPTVLIARTDALGAALLTSDVDPRDRAFVDGRAHRRRVLPRRRRSWTRPSRARSAYAPYCDLLWCETSTPDLDDARAFADAVHAAFPDKPLAYNCSPSFNWKRHLDDGAIATFQKELGAMGYRFQFITLAGFHALNAGMFDLAKGYADEGMSAYVKLQEREFALEGDGYTAVKHQREVGTGWFDLVSRAVGGSATLALEGSTEAAQF